MNTKKPLTLMCVQPCISYYAWQLEVMLQNFTDLCIHDNYDIHILCAYNTNEKEWEENKIPIEKVEKKYAGIAKFFYCQDTREYPISYISSIRPNILKQHFQENKDIIADTVFYHDCDIVFTKFPDFFEKYIYDNDWYVSDTKSYIGYDYILSKGQDVLDEMCSIVGISQDLVKSKQEQSGGAQYIMKGVDYEFFHKMEKDCELLYKNVNKLNRIKKQEDPSHHELQIWCSDMWAILWGAWMKGYNTNIVEEMAFCWATDNLEKWNEKYIFHNAGVTGHISKTHFYKADFRVKDKYPYLHDSESYLTDKASFKYFELIKSIGEKSCLL
jgi:hypothetical protein